ncbi:hypothetical protein VQ042_22480 [Aurantimonas sp. A2-1-M11]|uniref:hypothetical protein n=1 Tax=Aurantimonas sp. A2-1-M11 TaxID=3113712 RepID=UPI002F9571E1
MSESIAAGAVPLAWEDRKEGCWRGLRNGKVLASVMSLPDGSWQWSLRGVNPFGISKSAGTEDSLEGAMAAAQASWDRWCAALGLTAV